ncbi:hypothetical protein ACS5PN_05425 [Roseateles sp. NT4]|uniref:hypothetical protein n=1 Tax=Roseateles sp. NT4 TaxID=3453715 RepID=UPI003EEDF44C
MNEQALRVDLLNEIESWERFVSEWCLGASPRDPQSVVRDALQALLRNIPEYLERIQAESGRGLAVVSSLVHAGKVLFAVEKLAGFHKVVKRVRGGEKPAWAELEFAARCIGVGLHVVLEPPLNGKVLDCSISLGDGVTYVEVICPTASQSMREALQRLRGISAELIAACPGTRTELLLTDDPALWRPESVMAIKAFSMVDEVIQIGQGLVRKIPFDPLSALTKERFQVSRPGPLLIWGQVELDAGHFTAAEVAIQIDDDRAHRIFSAEHHQFHREATNVLVVDVTGVHDGIRGWEPLVHRWFQPTRNRRVGGILLWTTFRAGNPMSVMWESIFIPNPYALFQISQDIQARLAAMDESEGRGRI